MFDRLLADSALDDRQHAAALAYAALRRRFGRKGDSLRSPDQCVYSSVISVTPAATFTPVSDCTDRG